MKSVWMPMNVSLAVAQFDARRMNALPVKDFCQRSADAACRTAWSRVGDRTRAAGPLPSRVACAVVASTGRRLSPLPSPRCTDAVEEESCGGGHCEAAWSRIR